MVKIHHLFIVCLFVFIVTNTANNKKNDCRLFKSEFENEFGKYICYEHIEGIIFNPLKQKKHRLFYSNRNITLSQLSIDEVLKIESIAKQYFYENKYFPYDYLRQYLGFVENDTRMAIVSFCKMEYEYLYDENFKEYFTKEFTWIDDSKLRSFVIEFDLQNLKIHQIVK